MGNIEELANSIRQTGQQEPILVRPIKHNGLFDRALHQYEIIFGNRRWKACKLIGKKVKAIVKNLNDQEAIIAQKEENGNRKSISNYARAIHYKKLIDSCVFLNENQLALKLNISRKRLNDLMAYTRIPKQLLNAIPNVHKLSQRLAIKIASLSRDPANLSILMKLTHKIGKSQVSSQNIEKSIEQVKNGKTSDLIKSCIPVFGKESKLLFTLQENSKGVFCIEFHKSLRQVIDMDELTMVMKNYIDQFKEKNIRKEAGK